MIRGLWTHSSVLYKVDDDKLYSVDSSGALAEVGTLNSLSGVVDFESNLTQLVVNDGSYLYVYTPATGTFEESTGYTGGDRISFLDQRINVLQRGTQKLYWTPLGTALTISALDFKSAESSPDPIVSQISFNSELLIVGGESTETWDTSGSDAVYTKTSAAIDYGCLATHSLQKSANSAFWLAKDKQGQAIVVQLQGHSARRISDRSQEERFEGIELAGATAFTYSDGGQSFYCLNVPALDTTLVYDETYRQWHERAEWNGTYSKWRPTCHAAAYGKHYFGAGDDLYILDRNVHTYGDDVKRRQRIAPVISSPSRDRVFFPSFELVCDKGTGGQAMLRWSDDNGAKWSNWHYRFVGATGQYKHRAKWDRLGSAYDRVFDLVMTDPVAYNPVQVNIPL